MADWMDEENERAEDTAQTGETTNAKAPQLVRVNREPARKQKNFYIQDTYAAAFETLVFKQKLAKGPKAPQLAEEALDMLFEKYGIDPNNL
ncbi:hypothetical protein LZS85_15650 [Aliivibrio fischeri]|uniref:hypothetical protein n=1 Tax=Aliivibrio fischeri TaxID=668 RepID=UPI001F34535D|nr:hypothetical protein [Aliivibrio fischeri]MCE7567558.1 hypothetical protein [Aliivibrio fischeri]